MKNLMQHHFDNYYKPEINKSLSLIDEIIRSFIQNELDSFGLHLSYEKGKIELEDKESCEAYKKFDLKEVLLNRLYSCDDNHPLDDLNMAKECNQLIEVLEEVILKAKEIEDKSLKYAEHNIRNGMCYDDEGNDYNHPYIKDKIKKFTK